METEKNSFGSIENYTCDMQEIFSGIMKAAGVSNVDDPKVTNLLSKVVDLVSKYRQLSYQEGWKDGINLEIGKRE